MALSVMETFGLKAVTFVLQWSRRGLRQNRKAAKAHENVAGVWPRIEDDRAILVAGRLIHSLRRQPQSAPRGRRPRYNFSYDPPKVFRSGARDLPVAYT